MKITRVENENNFKFKNVEVRKATLKDITEVGKHTSIEKNQYEFYAGLISRVCIFDGQNYPPEEISKMDISDFLELAQELGEFGSRALGNELSTLQDTEI